MIQFDVLNVTESNNKFYLNIDVTAIDEGQQFWAIERILIDTQDTFVEGGPSLNAIEVFSPPLFNTKKVTLHLSEEQGLNDISSNIYFVYVIPTITVQITPKDSTESQALPPDYTTSQLNSNMTLGITYYEQHILRKYLKYIKEIDKLGEIPKNFIDYYLKVKSFEISLKTGHYLQAIDYWKYFK